MSKIRFSYTDGSVPLEFTINPRLAANNPDKRPTRLSIRRTTMESPSGQLNETAWLEFDDVDSALAALDLAADSHIEVVEYVAAGQSGTISRKIPLVGVSGVAVVV